jgi:glyoxylase-like metal-dependent hydrolase (beta-lactamase superfamily II)
MNAYAGEVLNHIMHTLPAGVTFFERGWLSSNNVLLQDASQAVLVDSGYWTHADQMHALVSFALKHQPLTTLINTHLHSDHCGGNAHLQAMYPALKTLIPPGHAEFVDTWDAQILTYEPTGQHCPPFTRTGSLHDGDFVTVNEKIWRIHAAPGHDPNSVVIFNEVDGVLISADALWENGFGVVFPEIEGLSAFDEVESTLNTIEELDPKLVLPGHGCAFTDVSSAIDRARSRLEQFRRSPEKHANYAAKVLLKFKLLEFQKIKINEFLLWGDSAKYLKLLSDKYAIGQSFEAWFYDLCKSLEKSNACAIDDEYIININ